MAKKILKRGSTGRIIAHETSDMQLEFIKLMSNGYEQAEAAKIAGYADPIQSGYRLMRLGHIAESIKKEISFQLSGDIGSLSMKRLKTLLKDDNTPHNVAFAAVKWVMEHNGFGVINRPKSANETLESKPLSEMTLEELETFIQAGKTAEQRLKVIDVAAESSDKT